MNSNSLSCREANQLDLVGYLEKIGFTPHHVRNNDYWFLSPLRDEKTPSFKVNRKLNVWYDHGIGKGGTLVDFGKLYYNCSVREFLEKLSADKGMNFSFRPQHNTNAIEKKKQAAQSGKIIVLNTREISDASLKKYLEKRKIPLTIAGQFCKEVHFELYGKKQLAIGFKNNSGGYELRNQKFKGCTTPKEPLLITRDNKKDLAVFEGFFSFLSYLSFQQSENNKKIELPELQAAYLILNSVSFFQKSREQMEKFERIHLFLDRDKMGLKCSSEALAWSKKYVDQSHCYKGYKDLNDCLVDSLKIDQKQSPGKRMRL